MSSMVEDPSSNIPAQTQMHHPGVEAKMEGPKPQYYSDNYVPAGMTNHPKTTSAIHLPFCNVICNVSSGTWLHASLHILLNQV